jgi:radical SAM protein with 4Fe4S-binding SPASM domain
MNFYQLEITTMIGCPLMCTYCPQDTLRDAYGDDAKYMSFEDFKTMIDKVPTFVRIDFSGQAEPWVNPACTDMVEYVLNKGHRIAIFTTLYNWDQETVHRMGQIVLTHAKQIDIFKVHFPDAAGNMKGWKHSEEWEYAYIGMRTIVQSAGVHYEAMTMSDEGIDPAIRHLPGAAPSHRWDIAAHDRAGTLDREQIKGQVIRIQPKHDYPVVCSRTSIYNQGLLLPNGDVLLCCMDYAKKHTIGNLLKDSYEDLFTNAPMQKLLEINSKPYYTNESLCKSCVDAIPDQRFIKSVA